ncbi:MAG: hypothetical protein ABH857_05755 [Elusimicrobiota bacterium]
MKAITKKVFAITLLFLCLSLYLSKLDSSKSINNNTVAFESIFANKNGRARDYFMLLNNINGLDPLIKKSLLLYVLNGEQSLMNSEIAEDAQNLRRKRNWHYELRDDPLKKRRLEPGANTLEEFGISQHEFDGLTNEVQSALEKIREHLLIDRGRALTSLEQIHLEKIIKVLKINHSEKVIKIIEEYIDTQIKIRDLESDYKTKAISLNTITSLTDLAPGQDEYPFGKFKLNFKNHMLSVCLKADGKTYLYRLPKEIGMYRKVRRVKPSHSKEEFLLCERFNGTTVIFNKQGSQIGSYEIAIEDINGYFKKDDLIVLFTKNMRYPKIIFGNRMDIYISDYYQESFYEDRLGFFSRARINEMLKRMPDFTAIKESYLSNIISIHRDDLYYYFSTESNVWQLFSHMNHALFSKLSYNFLLFINSLDEQALKIILMRLMAFSEPDFLNIANNIGRMFLVNEIAVEDLRVRSFAHMVNYFLRTLLLARQYKRNLSELICGFEESLSRFGVISALATFHYNIHKEVCGYIDYNYDSCLYAFLEQMGSVYIAYDNILLELEELTRELFPDKWQECMEMAAAGINPSIAQYDSGAYRADIKTKMEKLWSKERKLYHLSFLRYGVSLPAESGLSLMKIKTRLSDEERLYAVLDTAENGIKVSLKNLVDGVMKSDNWSSLLHDDFHYTAPDQITLYKDFKELNWGYIQTEEAFLRAANFFGVYDERKLSKLKKVWAVSKKIELVREHVKALEKDKKSGVVFYPWGDFVTYAEGSRNVWRILRGLMRAVNINNLDDICYIYCYFSCCNVSFASLERLAFAV